MAETKAIDVVRLLTRARERIERGWCANGFAETHSGSLCHPSAPYAERWCLLGAIIAAAEDLGLGNVENARTREKARELVEDVISGADLCDWNDEGGRTRRQVLAVLELAVKRATA